jgi:hypothetical protein
VPNAPWVITEEFLDEHQIDYVAHDALPYADTTLGTGRQGWGGCSWQLPGPSTAFVCHAALTCAFTFDP